MSTFPKKRFLVRRYMLKLGRFSKWWKLCNWSLKCWKFLRLTKWCDGQIGTGTGWWAIKRSLYEGAKMLILNLIIRKCSSRSESKSLVRCCRMRWRSTWRRATPSPPPFSRHQPHHKDIIMAMDIVAKASSAPPPCSPPPPPSLPPPPPCCCQAPQASSRRSSSSQSLRILQTAPRRPASVFLKLWLGEDGLLEDLQKILAKQACNISNNCFSNGRFVSFPSQWQHQKSYVCSGMISKKTWVFHLENLGQTMTSLISPWHVKMASK